MVTVVSNKYTGSYCVISSILNISSSPLAVSPSVKEQGSLRTCTQEEPKAGGKSGATEVKHHSPETQHFNVFTTAYVLVNFF